MEWITEALAAVHHVFAFQFSLGKSKLSLQSVAEALVACVVVVALVMWVCRLVERRLLPKALDDLSLRKIIANTLRVVLVVLGLLTTMAAVGVDLTALSVLSGAVGVGIGFGMQKLAANYVSGFVILLERSLRIGDTVKVDGFEGKVIDMKTRYTVLRATTGRESIVPNEKLITERIENLSKLQVSATQQMVLQVAHGSNAAQVQALLLKAMQQHQHVLPHPAPSVVLSTVGLDGLTYTLTCATAGGDDAAALARSEVLMALLDALAEQGVAIARAAKP